MKVFGKEVLSKKKVHELYDFAQHGLVSSGSYVTVANAVTWNTYGNVTGLSPEPQAPKKSTTKPKKPRKRITPKELYRLQSLNRPDLALNCGKPYIDEQIGLLERKIKLLPETDEEVGKIKYSREELQSLVERLSNRLQYKEHEDFFSEYSYTTSESIEDVLGKHEHLRSERVEEFVPDLPQEAIDAIDNYNEHTQELCGKKAVFYIIADKKDFEKSSKKRDPLLLAQSPFGLFWQILGAWDEEMILLEEL